MYQRDRIENNRVVPITLQLMCTGPKPVLHDATNTFQSCTLDGSHRVAVDRTFELPMSSLERSHWSMFQPMSVFLPRVKGMPPAFETKVRGFDSTATRLVHMKPAIATSLSPSSIVKLTAHDARTLASTLGRMFESNV